MAYEVAIFPTPLEYQHQGNMILEVACICPSHLATLRQGKAEYENGVFIRVGRARTAAMPWYPMEVH